MKQQVLDTETEIAVMKSIKNLGSHYTALMIAHHLSTLKECSMLVKLNHDKTEAVESYEELALPIIESK